MNAEMRNSKITKALIEVICDNRKERGYDGCDDKINEQVK